MGEGVGDEVGNKVGVGVGVAVAVGVGEGVRVRVAVGGGSGVGEGVVVAAGAQLAPTSVPRSRMVMTDRLRRCFLIS